MKDGVVWQELELRQLIEEEREGSRRVNKVRAQQLKEVQQKEGEQLRELQHLKAGKAFTRSPPSSTLAI